MKMFYQPNTVEEALSALQEAGERAACLGGGTDLIPRYSRGFIQKPDAFVDLKGISALSEISKANQEISVGACVRMSDLAENPTIRQNAPVLAEAAGRIACAQVRNRATLGGNLSNASPAADTAIPLLLLEAMLHLARDNGQGVVVREVPLEGFFRGPGKTVLGTGEILTRIRFKPVDPHHFYAWDKFGTRPSMEIATVSVGVKLELDKGIVSNARIGYGSVAPVPYRGVETEDVLVDQPLNEETIRRAVTVAREEIAPISDQRAGADYRRDLVSVMLRRMLESAPRD